MSKRFKKITLIILAIGALIIIATVSINNILKNKLETFIQNRLPAHMIRSYDALTIASFGGTMNISNASLIIKNKENENKHTYIHAENLKILNVSYWDYLFNNKIHIEKISVENPKITYYKDKTAHNKDSLRKGVFKTDKAIIVDKIQIINSKLAIYEKGPDTTKLYTKGLYIEIEGIKIDNNTLIRKIPFEYKSFTAKSDKVFVKVSPFENLSVESFSIEKNTAIFKDLSLKTKYSKRKLSRIIHSERDHYKLHLKSLSIMDFNFGFTNEGFFLESKKIIVTEPDLQLYRDKLVTDDLTTKPLYSKMLRELPFKLTVDSLKINNGTINYEERVTAENMGGSINFKSLNATISNVSNTYKAPTQTQVKLTANFMESTPFSVDWLFDVQNNTDQFLFKAEVGALVADKMNSFTEPNLTVRLEGNTNKTFFTIDGNNDTSTIDMKISYSDFKISVLRKNGKGKNKFLSAIANIFVSKDSEKENEYFREASAVAKRDKSKSVFNFLWINVKNALTKAMVGGSKE